MREVYLDNNATTELDPEVKKAMIEAMEAYGNASSHHHFGHRTKELIEQAREQTAKIIGAEASDIVFTGSGSEANNLAIKGVACEGLVCKGLEIKAGKHIITSQIEHPSVLNTCKCQEQFGFKVTYLPVDKYGLIDPGLVEKAINPNTSLITIMLANNEIGTIEPIKEIAKIARKHNLLFHTDAVQAVGKVDIDVHELGVDMLSLTGHKIHGPKGSGALYLRKGLSLCPLIHGGGQEKRRRAGTENVIGIVGLGKALEIARKSMPEVPQRMQRLRDMLWEGIKNSIPEVSLNGHPTLRLPSTLNVAFKYIEGESILMMMDSVGIGASTGSACSSDSLEPSHVLLAIGLPHEEAHGAVRFSVGKFNTEEDITYTLEKLPPLIARLREMSPLYNAKTS